MKSKTIKQVNTKSTKNSIMMEHLILFALGLLIIGAPLFRGLFFQKEILISHVFSFGIFIIYLVYKFKNKEEISILKSPYDLIGVSFIIVYLLPIITFQWVNLRDAIGMLLRYLNYFVIYLMVKDMSRKEGHRKIFEKALLFGSLIVALIGVLGATGYVNLADVVLGNRIASTFQYPNTLAALMMSMLFLVMGHINTTEKTSYKLLYGSLGFIYLFTFIFTYSRAAWLLLPFFLLIYLIVLPSKERISSLLYFTSIAISNLIILQPFNSYSSISSEISTKALATFIGGIALFLVIYAGMLIIQTKLKKQYFKYIYIALGVAIAATAFFIYIALTTFEPLSFDNTYITEDRLNQIERSIKGVEGDTSYIIQVKLQSQSQDEAQWPWRVRINGVDDVKNQELLAERVGSLSESGTIEIPFSTLTNTDNLNITLTNLFPQTKVIIDEVILKDIDGNVVNELKLKYRYIPESLVSRINSINLIDSSSTARITFYKDSLSIFKKYPIVGAGGGAWTALYPQFQSEAYHSTEAHNLFLQTLVETGILGILTLLMLVLIILLYLWRSIKEGNILALSIIVGILSLLAHSGLDFNFSFHSIPIILWVLIGMLVSLVPSKESLKSEIIISNKKKTGYLAVVSISAFCLLLSTSLVTAIYTEEDVNKSINQIPLIESINKMERAVKLDYYNSNLRIGLAKMMRYYGENSGEYRWIEQSEEYLLKAIKFNPNSISALHEIASFYFATGNFETGFEYVDRSIQAVPFNESSYEFKSEAYKAVSNFYLDSGLEQAAVGINEKMIDIIDEMGLANSRLSKPIQLSAKTLDNIFRAKYHLENLDNPDILAELEDIAYISYLDLEGATGFELPWRKYGPIGAQIDYIISADGLQVYNQGEKQGVVYSPFFTLEPGKRYEVEVIIYPNEYSEAITVQVASAGQQAQITQQLSLTTDSRKHTFEFFTNENLEPDKQYITFGHSGRTDKYFTIKQVIVREIY